MKTVLFLAVLQLAGITEHVGAVPAQSAPAATRYGLSARTTGAVDAQVSRDDAPSSLGSPRSHGPGFSGWFALTGSALQRAELAVDDVRGGEVGEELPARVRLVVGDRSYESADCVATVTSQTPQAPTRGRATGQSFVVEGSLRCHAALRDPSLDAPELVVEQFDFALPVAWDFDALPTH